jgi:hypothetical protein
LRDLKELMDTLKWGCPTHYMFGDNDPVEHRATTCSYRLCGYTDAGWKAWRSGITFAKGQCWGCGIDNEVSLSCSAIHGF